jgi:CIC family chloride channel protein
MSRQDAFMAVVVGREPEAPRAGDVLGIITKDHIADSVAASIRIYPGER